MKLKVSNALQSVDFSNDILQILPDEMLTEYIDICKQRLPHAMVGHHFLLMQNRTKSFLKQPENHRLSEIISAKCKFLIFVPRNANKTNCTFFGVTEEALKHKPDFNVAITFTLQSSCEELSQCFYHTKRIEWGCGKFELLIDVTYLKVIKPLFDMIANHNDLSLFDLMRMPVEIARNITYTVPDDVYIGSLRQQHVNEINNLWFFKSADSAEHIRSLILLNGGIGVFDKATDELLSWVILTEYFNPGFLQTKPYVQKRGYALLIVNAYCKHFADKENLDLFAHVFVDNVASRTLLASVGFEIITTSITVNLTKRKSKRGSLGKL